MRVIYYSTCTPQPYNDFETRSKVDNANKLNVGDKFNEDGKLWIVFDETDSYEN